MKLVQTAIPDVVVIEPAVFADSRGWFMESFNEQRFHAELAKLGLPVPRAFVQDNHSFSHKGVLRGLHYQLPPHPQGKLVRVVRGAALDVAVDIRKGSPTLGQWVAVELTATNQRMLWIPEGFAMALWHWKTIPSFFTRPLTITQKTASVALLGMMKPWRLHGRVQ